MTIRPLNDLRRSWHQVECPFCAASSWAKCRTPAGRLLTRPHVARVVLAERNPHRPDPLTPSEKAFQLRDFHDRIAAAIPELSRGKVWCKTCGREQDCAAAAALRSGWPTCHGQTMTIDHPSTWL